MNVTTLHTAISATMRRSRKLINSFCLITLFTPTASIAQTPIYSDLWGQKGEKWTPQSRLPDFSFAGYEQGEKPVPTLPVVANVKDFGAKGDGVTDDSAAFLAAISSAQNGAVFIPEGRYIIRKRMMIKKANFVLRGAGRGKTVLYFPDHLTTVVGPDIASTSGGVVTSNYSWSHGFIEFSGPSSGRGSLLANVTNEVDRGAKTFLVDSAAKLTVGMRVYFSQINGDDNTLGNHINADQYPAGSLVKGREMVNLVAKITAINGQEVTIERPLRTNVRTKWKPTLYALNYAVQNVGVESLTMEYPPLKYMGHHTENGYNGIQFKDVMNCWIKNVGFYNADSGVFVFSSRSCTFDDMEYDSVPERAGTVGTKNEQGSNGHHGIYFDYGSTDMLMQNFNYKTQWIHEMTVGKYANGNVFRNGKGVNVAFDNHSMAPYENLYSNIDAGAGTRSIYFSGGGAPASWGPHTAARTTFWRITTVNAQSFPNRMWPEWSPDQINIIGIKGAIAGEKNPTRRWFETIAPEQLYPQDLYQAQVDKRKAEASPFKPLIASHSNLCLDVGVGGGSLIDGAPIVQRTCDSNSDSQKWEIIPVTVDQFAVRVKHTGRCLDVNAASTADGAIILQWPCTGRKNQLWNVIDRGAGLMSFKSVNSGKCLDVNAISMLSDAPLIQWTCKDAPQQKFR